VNKHFRNFALAIVGLGLVLGVIFALYANTAVCVQARRLAVHFEHTAGGLSANQAVEVLRYKGGLLDFARTATLSQCVAGLDHDDATADDRGYRVKETRACVFDSPNANSYWLCMDALDTQATARRHEAEELRSAEATEGYRRAAAQAAERNRVRE
jgi:hypothetical protein